MSLEETSTVDTATKGIGVGLSGAGVGIGIGKGETTGTIQSNLADKLRPPEQPQLAMSGCGILGVWIASVIFFGIALAIFFATEGVLLPVLGSGFFLVLGVGFIVFRKPIARADQELQANYDKEKAAWERRWYCKKCGEFSEPTS